MDIFIMVTDKIYFLTRIATIPPCIPLKKRNFLLKNI